MGFLLLFRVTSCEIPAIDKIGQKFSEEFSRRSARMRKRAASGPCHMPAVAPSGLGYAGKPKMRALRGWRLTARRSQRFRAREQFGDVFRSRIGSLVHF